MAGEFSKSLEVDGRAAADDAGEAVTVSDTTGDAWVFHVVGGLPGITKSGWAAHRSGGEKKAEYTFRGGISWGNFIGCLK